jgi:hypothetical protein
LAALPQSSAHRWRERRLALQEFRKPTAACSSQRRAQKGVLIFSWCSSPFVRQIIGIGDFVIARVDIILSGL